MQHENTAKNKSLAKFYNRISLRLRAAIVPLEKENGNGLEDAEDRRGAGWHGDQHVCLRGPQISACDS
jgi:hypothetical protein